MNDNKKIEHVEKNWNWTCNRFKLRDVKADAADDINHFEAYQTNETGGYKTKTRPSNKAGEAGNAGSVILL